MRMKELGELFMPWRYSPVGEECIISDSVIAYDFFRNSLCIDGFVGLAQLKLASLQYPCVPAWLYFLPEEGVQIDYQFVFETDIGQSLYSATILDTIPMKDNCFFFWKEDLYCTATTSTGEVMVKRVRALLSQNDVLTFQRLAYGGVCRSIFPVKLYALNDGRFLATCWALEMDNGDTLYEAVSSEDERIVDEVQPDDTTYFPISLGERAIIGDVWYELCCNSTFGTYFNRLPVQPTKLFRQTENLVLDKRRRDDDKPRFEVMTNAQAEVLRGASNRRSNCKISIFNHG